MKADLAKMLHDGTYEIFKEDFGFTGNPSKDDIVETEFGLMEVRKIIFRQNDIDIVILGGCFDMGAFELIQNLEGYKIA